MALVVGTDTYKTSTELTAYATARAITILASDKDVILLKAMDYIESRIYSGYKTDSTQALEFPRNGDTTVPVKIGQAQMVAALLIDSGVNLFAAIERGIKREKVDIIETEYQTNATEYTRYPELEVLLSPFIYAGVSVNND